jgi:hypothetical protein
LSAFALKRHFVDPIYFDFGGKVGGQSFAKIVTASSLQGATGDRERERGL